MNLVPPVKNPKICQSFGVDNTQHPQRKEFYKLFDNKHCGVDFEAPVSTPVYASFEGIVVRKEFHKGMGNVIGIRNGNIVALYAHLSEFRVSLGDTISTGALIGLSGATGDACPTPHLHFEVRDISKKDLRNMVFDPLFGKEIKQYKPTFVYRVNNVNTKKTLPNLSKLYFGVTDYWNYIGKVNDLKQGALEILKHGTRLLIPNYTNVRN